jgi:hypothetical protein
VSLVETMQVIQKLYAALCDETGMINSFYAADEKTDCS